MDTATHKHGIVELYGAFLKICNEMFLGPQYHFALQNTLRDRLSYISFSIIGLLSKNYGRFEKKMAHKKVKWPDIIYIRAITIPSKVLTAPVSTFEMKRLTGSYFIMTLADGDKFDESGHHLWHQDNVLLTCV